MMVAWLGAYWAKQDMPQTTLDQINKFTN
jgi:hypothetical protein